MATIGGPKIVTDELVFGYDTGYPLVSGSFDTYKFNRGEPTENLVGNPTFIGTSGTQTQGVTPSNWVFSGESGPNGFKFYDSSSSPIPLKFPNEGSVITINSGSSNRRIYFRRTDLLPDTTYTISCWMYFSGSFQSAWSKFQYDSTGSNIAGGYFDNFSSYASANGHSLEEWFLWEGTLTTESTTAQCFWGPVISKGYKILVGMQRMKVEVKDHRTPFVNGTRSVSGSLIDLTRTTDIDLSNVSFDSNAQMTFDGTDDYINCGTQSGLDSGDVTIEFVAKLNTSNTVVVGKHYNNFEVRIESTLFGGYVGHTGGWREINDANVAHGVNILNYNHYTYVFSYSTNNLYMYANGEYKGAFVGTSQGVTLAHHTTGTNLEVGRRFNGTSYLDGEVRLLKAYNRALTAAEVKQNYNAIKERFKI